MPDVDFAKFASVIAVNPPGQYEGPALASATTITLSHPVHKVTGTTAIATINPPFTGFVGHCVLVPTGASSVTTGGNVAAAVSFTANRRYEGYYDGSLWYF